MSLISFEVVCIDGITVPIEKHLLDRIPTLQNLSLGQVKPFEPEAISKSLFRKTSPNNAPNTDKSSSCTQSNGVDVQTIRLKVPIRGEIFRVILDYVKTAVISEGKHIVLAETPIYAISEKDLYEVTEAALFLGL
jgi:hypothetical protein